MKPVLGLVAGILALAPLAAQEADSALAGDIQYLLLPLPVWSSPVAGLTTGATYDTLRLEIKPVGRPILKWVRWQRLAGLGMLALGGTLSYYYRQEADQAFAAYRRSGNPDELDRLFRKSRALDRRAGWSYVAAEAGLIMLSVSFIIDP
ncbi:MAG: hypothetical protein IID13_01620 [Candidatus Marinimicrobia bacterium]|nr:hypothetical protein [Candidatus Neomarinimicrobiota bacterium]